MPSSQISDLQTYQWDASSLITRVDLRSRGKAGVVAYVQASEEHPDLPQLHALREIFQAKGWTASSDIRGGESVLRVQGIRKPQELLDLLSQENVTQGTPHITAFRSDKPKPFFEKIKSHSMRLSGIVYTLGNSLYVVSGLKRGKDFAQMKTGIAFASGDLAVAAFGGKDEERQFKSVMAKLDHHLQKNGGSIPKDTAFAAEISTKGESLGEKTYNLMHAQIDKIKAAAEMAGGYYYFKAGKDQKNVWKQITAVIFSLGFGSTIFVPEKKTDPEEMKHAGTLKKAWAFVQESPLRIAGWSGLSNTVLTTVGAFQERKKELLLPKSQRVNAYPIDLATAGTMLVANNLYALSNKSTGGSITSDGLVSDLYGLTAQAINTLPEAQRDKAVKLTAGFLGDRIEIKDTRAQAEAKLRQHMLHAREENPWSKSQEETYHIEGGANVAPAPTTKRGTSWAGEVRSKLPFSAPLERQDPDKAPPSMTERLRASPRLANAPALT